MTLDIKNLHQTLLEHLTSWGCTLFKSTSKIVKTWLSWPCTCSDLSDYTTVDFGRLCSSSILSVHGTFSRPFLTSGWQTWGKIVSHSSPKKTASPKKREWQSEPVAGLPSERAASAWVRIVVGRRWVAGKRQLLLMQRRGNRQTPTLRTNFPQTGN